MCIDQNHTTIHPLSQFKFKHMMSINITLPLTHSVNSTISSVSRIHYHSPTQSIQPYQVYQGYTTTHPLSQFNHIKCIKDTLPLTHSVNSTISNVSRIHYHSPTESIQPHQAYKYHTTLHPLSQFNHIKCIYKIPHYLSPTESIQPYDVHQ